MITTACPQHWKRQQTPGQVTHTSPNPCVSAPLPAPLFHKHLQQTPPAKPHTRISKTNRITMAGETANTKVLRLLKCRVLQVLLA
jgi:hypothetical protein